MIEVKECPVCSSISFESAFECKDYSISQKEFQLIRCKKCNFLITSPRPDHDELNEYYKSENYISHSDTAQGLINKLYHVVRKITLRKKISLIEKQIKSPTLLDIGSGAGYFLNSCKQHGFNVVGIEPDINSRNRSIKQFGIDVYDESKLDQLEASSFDVITLWHVLEHVEDLHLRIHQINKLLKTEGIVILALPNCTSYDAQYYQNYWAGYDVPRHLWHFTPNTIALLMQQFGFEIFKIVPMHYDAYYVSMLSEKYKKSNVGLLRGIFRGLISNTKAGISRNNTYSSQIYLLRKR